MARVPLAPRLLTSSSLRLPPINNGSDENRQLDDDNGGGGGGPIRKKRTRVVGLSEQDRALRRKIKNRVAAQKARDQKKTYVDELEARLQKLEATTQRLEEQNSRLLDENRSIKEENRRLLQQRTDTLSQELARHQQQAEGDDSDCSSTIGRQLALKSAALVSGLQQRGQVKSLSKLSSDPGLFLSLLNVWLASTLVSTSSAAKTSSFERSTSSPSSCLAAANRSEMMR